MSRIFYEMEQAALALAISVEELEEMCSTEELRVSRGRRSSLEPRALEGGARRARVPGRVSGSAPLGKPARVAVGDLPGRDAGAEASLFEVYAEGVPVPQASEDTVLRGLGGKERDPDSLHAIRGKPIREHG